MLTMLWDMVLSRERYLSELPGWTGRKILYIIEDIFNLKQKGIYMKTMFILSTALILTAFACGGSNNPAGPTPGNDSEFYPLAVGNIWMYDCSGTISLSGVQMGTISGITEVEITGTETHSEGFDVFVQVNAVCDTTEMYGQTFVTDSTFTEYIRITDAGLYGYSNLTNTDSSFTVPFPLQDGATWTFAEEPPTTGEILSMSANVTVGAGSFENCMEMQTVWTDSTMGGIVSNTADFARNVGRVSNVTTITEGTMLITYTNNLVTYSLN